MSQFEQIRSTTVIAVKRNGKVAMAGDGQVTMGNTVMKGMPARYVRYTTERFLQALQEPRQMHLPFLTSLKRS